MVATEVLKVRVPPDTKQIVRSLAQQQQLTESALLMRLVETMLQTSGAIRARTFDSPEPAGRGARGYRTQPEPDRQSCPSDRPGERSDRPGSSGLIARLRGTPRSREGIDS